MMTMAMMLMIMMIMMSMIPDGPDARGPPNYIFYVCINKARKIYNLTEIKQQAESTTTIIMQIKCTLNLSIRIS